jgi:hypothetical protein
MDDGRATCAAMNSSTPHLSATLLAALASSDPRTALGRLERLAWLMDSALRIPGTRHSVGLDALLSFVPGVGSLAGAGVSLYLIAEAVRHGAPPSALLRMGTNVVADGLVGAVPLIGPVFDMLYKANTKNMRILREHLEARIG